MKTLLSLVLLELIASCSTAPAPKPPTLKLLASKPLASKPSANSATAEERYAAKIYALRADWAKASLRFYHAFYEPRGGPVDSPALREIFRQYRLQNRRYTQVSPVPVSLRSSHKQLQNAFAKIELALQQNESFLRDGRAFHNQKAEALNNQAADLMGVAVKELQRVVSHSKPHKTPTAPAVPPAPRPAHPPSPTFSQPPLSNSA